ncbi:MAG: DNA glycosylase AlkZ-like family protein [[Clostridium] innocuum]
MRTITREEVRSHLYHAQHLVIPADSLQAAAGVCGFQNSPPGTWLCAAFNRLPACSVQQLQQELDEGEGIVQAWSLRGAPWIFPLSDASVFLDALCAKEGEA